MGVVGGGVNHQQLAQLAHFFHPLLVPKKSGKGEKLNQKRRRKRERDGGVSGAGTLVRPASQLIKTTPTDQLELWSCPPLSLATACHGLAPRPTRLEITAIAGVVELRLGWERLKWAWKAAFALQQSKENPKTFPIVKPPHTTP